MKRVVWKDMNKTRLHQTQALKKRAATARRTLPATEAIQ